MYWKLLIFRLRQSSVSLDFLKTTRGLRLLNDRNNGTFTRNEDEDILSVIGLHHSMQNWISCGYHTLQLPLNLAWNKSLSLVPLNVKKRPDVQEMRTIKFKTMPKKYIYSYKSIMTTHLPYQQKKVPMLAPSACNVARAHLSTD